MRKRKSFILETWQILLILISLIFLPFIPQFTSYFPFLIFIVIVAFLIGSISLIIYNQKQISQTKALEISDIDNMSGIEFEKYVGKVLLHQKYKINFTKASNDFGVDILAIRNGIKYSIQLKRLRKSVGRRAISDAVAGMAHYKCQKSMVITNNYFTKLAKELAKSNQTILIDRDKLSEWILDFQK